MRKDTHLVNIYLKIHNKRALTIDDLRYLARYAPECFEKTCRNVVYNMPETESLMNPDVSVESDEKQLPQISERQKIENVLANLKTLETEGVQIANVDADNVKSLLGNLYMEMLFPHNDRDTFFDVTGGDNISSFDAKI